MSRIVYALVLCLSFFFLPWWAWLFFGLVGALFFRNFYEFVLIALVGDTVSGFPNSGFFHIPYFLLLVALGVVIFSEPLKKNIIFFSKNQNVL